jgi:heat shock protein HslJ
MKSTALILVFFSLFILGCRKDNTESTNITNNDWEIKSITLNSDKDRVPKKNSVGNKYQETSFKLDFENDTTLNFYLSINQYRSSFSIPIPGQINIGESGGTKACCNTDFDTKLLTILQTVDSYEILGKKLILKGTSGEIELKMK